MTEKDKDKYLEGGGRACPHCGVNNLLCTDLRWKGDALVMSTLCLECEQSWRDFYCLSDMQPD
jgi:hypothetical protein